MDCLKEETQFVKCEQRSIWSGIDPHCCNRNLKIAFIQIFLRREYNRKVTSMFLVSEMSDSNLIPSFTSCVILGYMFNLSEIWFYYLKKNEINNKTFIS